MKVVRPRVSYGDLARAPEDGRRYEIYDGEVFVVPSPLPRHQIVALNLAELFREYARANSGHVLISPIDIVFSEYDVVQPDVVYFTAARRHLVQPDAPIRERPDITVEVLSPSTAATDRGKKMQLFARYGVPEYWLVDPHAQRIEIHRLGRGSYLLAQTAGPDDIVRSAILPDLRFPAARIFPAH